MLHVCLDKTNHFFQLGREEPTEPHVFLGEEYFKDLEERQAKFQAFLQYNRDVFHCHCFIDCAFPPHVLYSVMAMQAHDEMYRQMLAKRQHDAGIAAETEAKDA